MSGHLNNEGMKLCQRFSLYHSWQCKQIVLLPPVDFYIIKQCLRMVKNKCNFNFVNNSSYHLQFAHF